MQHGTMQHHHIIAGKHLKQAKCSSRQKVEAGTFYHATSSHHSRQTSQAGKMFKQAKCSSRQKVQARKSSSRNILPCNMQHETVQHATCNMVPCNIITS